MTTWKQITDYAALAGAKFPECVAAQWALESGFGAHVSGKNNFFGIKGRPGTTVSTKEYVDGKWITIKDTFKDFAGAYDCVKYLVKHWYRDYGVYQGINRANSREECAELLVSEGYATDPDYAEKLIKLMNDNVEEAPTGKGKSFLEDAALYYSGESHQIAAWRALEGSLGMGVLKGFKAAYRNAPLVVEEVVEESRKQKFPLQVPYFNQNDSATDQGFRMCFTSSMAMALDYIDPEAIEGDDDWYLDVVFKYGDTVSYIAQEKAARSLGFSAKFRMDGSQKNLEKLLDQGLPVPIGILHHGHVDSPTGGGHYICLIGYDETHFWVHDPAGVLDLVNGGYHTWDAGKGLRYSKKNLMKRWLINGSGADGWMMDLADPS